MPGRQRLDAGERRARRDGAPEGGDLGETDGVEFGAHQARREQALGLRGEHQPVAAARIEQRSDADAVAREHQAPLGGVPERDRELAVELGDEVEAELLVGVDDDFGVGLRVEPVACGHEALAQLDVVEDLAVEHDLDGAGLVVDRLVAGGEIDDAQARMREADSGRLEKAVAVRTAVVQRMDHPLEQAVLGDGVGRKRGEAGDAAHGCLPAFPTPEKAPI